MTDDTLDSDGSDGEGMLYVQTYVFFLHEMILWFGMNDIIFMYYSLR